MCILPTAVTPRTLLFNALSLAGPGPLSDRLADHGHEIFVFISCEAREVAELVLGT